ncbi:autophagy protein 12 [Neoconidiobolus thromboides FSU 785]|nr:autophagy protein 12 [Neoconidiobolus thromboides FSU 785]
MSETSSISTSTNKTKKDDKNKVVVRFRAVGNAPIMVQNHYKINSSYPFQTLVNFLKKQIKLKESDALFCYINSQFSPAPDESVLNLFKCFQVDNQLIVNYCSNPAWG